MGDGEDRPYEGTERRQTEIEFRISLVRQLTKLQEGQKNLSKKVDESTAQTKEKFKELSASIDSRFQGMKESITQKVSRVHKTLYGDGNGEQGLVSRITNLRANITIMNWKFAIGVAVIAFLMNLAGNVAVRALGSPKIIAAVAVSQPKTGGQTP